MTVCSRMRKDLRSVADILRSGEIPLGGGYGVIRALDVHLRAVLADLRPRDRREVAFFEAMQARPRRVETALEGCFTRSLSPFALLHKGTCLAVGGVTPLPEPGWGCPWMVGTTQLDASPRSFAVLAGVFAPLMRAVFPKLVNCTLQEKGPRGEAALVWLERCGFTLRRPVSLPGFASACKGSAPGQGELWNAVWVFYRA